MVASNEPRLDQAAKQECVATLAYEAALRGHQVHADAVKAYRTQLTTVLTVGIAVLAFLGKAAVEQNPRSAPTWLLVVGTIGTAAFGGLGLVALRVQPDLVRRQKLTSILDLQEASPAQARFWVAEAIDEAVSDGQTKLKTLSCEVQLLVVLLFSTALLWGAATVWGTT